MSFIADCSRDYELWEYTIGNIHLTPESFDGIYYDGNYGLSIATNRYYYLNELDNIHPLKIALMDPQSKAWTKWVSFPGQLLETIINSYGYVQSSGLTAAVDVHRCLLPNEIVIESDYPTYAENFAAAKVIGPILEKKGFIPHYYYSGNKSVHIHIFLDWDCFEMIDDILLSRLSVKYEKSLSRFKRAFIIWLRTKMIHCWDTKLKKFDEDLIRAAHLIRAELSKNKQGFKTFLGYTHKDLSVIPYICNEQNRIYPRLGTMKMSKPHCISELAEEFLDYQEDKDKTLRNRRLNKSLLDWTDSGTQTQIRDCIKTILSDDFKELGDGCKRGMFILLNELKRVYGVSTARVIALDWNARMNYPVKEQDIEYRLQKKSYSLSCDYIHSFLDQLGINVAEKCKGKIYI